MGDLDRRQISYDGEVRKNAHHHPTSPQSPSHALSRIDLIAILARMRLEIGLEGYSLDGGISTSLVRYSSTDLCCEVKSGEVLRLSFVRFTFQMAVAGNAQPPTREVRQDLRTKEMNILEGDTDTGEV